MLWNYDNGKSHYSSQTSINNVLPHGRAKSPERKHGSPYRSANSFSISPKKIGKDQKEKDPREVTKASRVGIVRFMNPKQGLFVTPQIPKEPVKDNSPKKR